MMDEAKDFGLVNGVSFPLSGVRNQFGIFSVAVDRDTKQTRTDIIHALGGVQLLASYLHDSVNRIVLCNDMGNMERKLTAGEQILSQKNK